MFSVFIALFIYATNSCIACTASCFVCQSVSISWSISIISGDVICHLSWPSTWLPKYCTKNCRPFMVTGYCLKFLIALCFCLTSQRNKKKNFSYKFYLKILPSIKMTDVSLGISLAGSMRTALMNFLLSSLTKPASTSASCVNLTAIMQLSKS